MPASLPNPVALVPKILLLTVAPPFKSMVKAMLLVAQKVLLLITNPEKLFAFKVFIVMPELLPLIAVTVRLVPIKFPVMTIGCVATSTLALFKNTFELVVPMPPIRQSPALTSMAVLKFSNCKPLIAAELNKAKPLCVRVVVLRTRTSPPPLMVINLDRVLFILIESVRLTTVTPAAKVIVMGVEVLPFA